MSQLLLFALCKVKHLTLNQLFTCLYFSSSSSSRQAEAPSLKQSLPPFTEHSAEAPLSSLSPQSLLERTDTLQSDLEGVLEASKDLITHLDPSAASLVQSESRLLSRGVLQLSQTLTGKLGQQQVRLHEWSHVFGFVVWI